MRLLFLTLMVVACGGQPVSSTQCLRESSLSGEDKLGCLYNPSSTDQLFRLLPKASALFSQQQDNGQQCLYDGKVLLSWLKFNEMRVSRVGQGKAITKFSLAAEDVYTALQVSHMAKELAALTPEKLQKTVMGGSVGLIVRTLKDRSSCRNAKFLYREAGDVFLRGNFTQHSDRLRDLCGDADASKIIEITAQGHDQKLSNILQVATKILSGERAVTYYRGWSNLIHPFRQVAGLYSTPFPVQERSKAVRQIKKVLPWVRSSGASACQKQVGI